MVKILYSFPFFANQVACQILPEVLLLCFAFFQGSIYDRNQNDSDLLL